MLWRSVQILQRQQATYYSQESQWARRRKTPLPFVEFAVRYENIELSKEALKYELYDQYAESEAIQCHCSYCTFSLNVQEDIFSLCIGSIENTC